MSQKLTTISPDMKFYCKEIQIVDKTNTSTNTSTNDVDSVKVLRGVVYITWERVLIVDENCNTYENRFDFEWTDYPTIVNLFKNAKEGDIEFYSGEQRGRCFDKIRVVGNYPLSISNPHYANEFYLDGRSWSDAEIKWEGLRYKRIQNSISEEFDSYIEELDAELQRIMRIKLRLVDIQQEWNDKFDNCVSKRK